MFLKRALDLNQCRRFFHIPRGKQVPGGIWLKMVEKFQLVSIIRGGGALLAIIINIFYGSYDI